MRRKSTNIRPTTLKAFTWAECKNIIRDQKLKAAEFKNWIYGQTCPMIGGKVGVYAWDLYRYIEWKDSLKISKNTDCRSIKTNIYKLNRDQEEAIKALYKPKASAPKKVDVYLNGKMVKLAMKKETARIKKALKSLNEDGTGWRG